MPCVGIQDSDGKPNGIWATEIAPSPTQRMAALVDYFSFVEFLQMEIRLANGRASGKIGQISLKLPMPLIKPTYLGARPS